MTRGVGKGCDDGVQLHEVAPREVVGRDVIARFRAQFRAAALASLEILKGGALDRVYCDFHDDFVLRNTVDGAPHYSFFQVKTRSSPKHQWTRLELFGLPLKTPPIAKAGTHVPGGRPAAQATVEQLGKIRKSFVGRLLEHTVAFGDSCAEVTFLTNAYFEDEVEAIASAVSAGEVGERTFRYLADNFEAVFEIVNPMPMARIHAQIRKLSLSAGHAYLDPRHPDFETTAMKAVWTYSEIDLSHIEGMELVEKLLALVEKKSSTLVISDLTPDDLDAAAGVGIDDLLDLLPVSRAAYYHFLTGGDAHALKSASILQRTLSQAGAGPTIIETASRWKVAWDNWFRTYRHTYEEEITFLQQDLNAIYGRWANGSVSFSGLQGEVAELKSKLSKGPLAIMLTGELLMGGVLSELVRSKTR